MSCFLLEGTIRTQLQCGTALTFKWCSTSTKGGGGWCWWACVNCSLFPNLSWAEWNTVRSSAASRFDMLSAQRSSSAYFDCNDWLLLHKAVWFCSRIWLIISGFWEMWPHLADEALVVVMFPYCVVLPCHAVKLFPLPFQWVIVHLLQHKRNETHSQFKEYLIIFNMVLILILLWTNPLKSSKPLMNCSFFLILFHPFL